MIIYLSDENLSQAFIHILDEKITLVEKKSDFEHVLHMFCLFLFRLHMRFMTNDVF